MEEYTIKNFPIMWPFKNWTLTQLRRTCEANKSLSHCCSPLFANYSRCHRKSDLVNFMETEMNHMIKMLLAHAIDEWNWIGYKFQFVDKWNGYQIIQVYLHK
jgi:hypothetical protein